MERTQGDTSQEVAALTKLLSTNDVTVLVSRLLQLRAFNYDRQSQVAMGVRFILPLSRCCSRRIMTQRPFTDYSALIRRF
jgi:hypothetical protein